MKANLTDGTLHAASHPETIITVAKTAGFCFGVRRALDISLTQAPAWTWGPMIHNQDQVDRLEKAGIHALNIDAVSDREALAMADTLPSGATLILRAHGVGRAVEEALRAKGLRVIDGTCPFVKAIHQKVGQEEALGRTIIVLGDPRHPEVKGIRGWCLKEPLIFRSLNEIMKNPPAKDQAYACVQQTTFDTFEMDRIVEFLRAEAYNVNVCSTICTATRAHQKEAVRLASESDLCLIIGGKHSSNTNKLFKLCRERCPQSFLIENATQLDQIAIPNGCRHIGITAGASTPDDIIEGVVEALTEPAGQK